VRRNAFDEEYQPAMKLMMAIILSAYHRAIDGVVTARVLDDVCPALEEPESVILYFLRSALHKAIEQ
jgi:pyruvate/2-oxoglutarate dehydrogenase complex dihydrolipoamide acyltransferase (E2) component